MIKRIFTLLIMVAVFAVSVPLTGNAFGVDTSAKVYDYAELFTTDENDLLIELANERSSELGIDFVVVTIEDSEGKSSEAYADDFYDYNGFKSNGVLLLINMQERYVHISTTGTCIWNINDIRIENLLDLVQPELSKGNYYKAAKAFIDKAYIYCNTESYTNNDDVPIYTDDDDITIAEENTPIVDSSMKVYDYAELFTQEEIYMLSELANEKGNELGIDIVLVTITDSGGKSNIAYADDFYDYNSFRSNGVLLLINMNDRYVYISTAGSCINHITDARIEKILDKVQPKLTDQNYYKGAEAFVKQSYFYCGGTKTIADRIGQSLEYFGYYVVVGLIVGLIVILVMVSKHKAKRTVTNNTYLKGDIDLVKANDFYVTTTVTKTRRATDSSSGGGGGSSTHSGSSGTSHGGGGRSF